MKSLWSWSHDRLGHTGQKTSVRLEEFAAPYHVLRTPGTPCGDPNQRGPSQGMTGFPPGFRETWCEQLLDGSLPGR